MDPARLSLANRAKFLWLRFPQRKLYTVLYLKVQGTAGREFSPLYVANPLFPPQFAPTHFHPGLPRSLLGSSNMSVTDAKNGNFAPQVKLPFLPEQSLSLRPAASNMALDLCT
jgi:hypothetical protein